MTKRARTEVRQTRRVEATAIWQERLEYLLEQEALEADAGTKFKLRKQIEEAETRLSELMLKAERPNDLQRSNSKVVGGRATENQGELSANSTSRPRHENFCNRRHWQRLTKIGEWRLTSEKDSLDRVAVIRGSGVFNYLLSSNKYGGQPFTILARMKFSKYDEFAGDGLDTANAGIVFGWQNTPDGHKYYNVLFTGTRLLLEEVGFRGGDAYRDFRHVDDGVGFELIQDRQYSFAIRVNVRSVDVFVDERMIYSVADTSPFVGKIGLRPWRSSVRCYHFEVHDA